jgi:hypothetical protein
MMGYLPAELSELDLIAQSTSVSNATAAKAVGAALAFFIEPRRSWMGMHRRCRTYGAHSVCGSHPGLPAGAMFCRAGPAGLAAVVFETFAASRDMSNLYR